MKKLYLSIILFIFISPSSFSLNLTWTGSTSNSWNDSSNFSPMQVPTENDTVTIDTTANHPVLSRNATVYKLIMLGDTLDLNGYELKIGNEGEFRSGVIRNGTLVCNGLLASFSGTEIDAQVNAFCSGIQLSGSVFHQTAWFEITGSASSTGEGGNVFHDKVTLKNNSDSSDFILANTSGDVFHDSLIVINQSIKAIKLAMSDVSFFYQAVVFKSSHPGTIFFGKGGGESRLDQDGHLVAEYGDFTSGHLILKSIHQQNNEDHRMVLIPTGGYDSHSLLIVEGCRFSGVMDATAPNVLLKKNVFEGDVMFTKSGGNSDLSHGGNVYLAPAIFTNTSTTGQFRLGGGDSDYYHENVTFNSDTLSLIAGNKTFSYFYKNVTVNSPKVYLAYAVWSGDVDQQMEGTATQAYLKLHIEKPNGKAVAQTPIAITGHVKFANGHLETDSTNIITFLAGSGAIDASNKSFVSGPVKKVGDTAFEFPVGKGESYAPVLLTETDSVNNSFGVEYFNFNQQLSYNVDTLIHSLSNMNYWRVEQITGSDSVYITLKWNEELLEVPRSNHGVYLAGLEDTVWKAIFIDTIGFENNFAFSTTKIRISSFGYFTVANTSAGSNTSAIITIDNRVQVWGSNSVYQHGSCTQNLLYRWPEYTKENIQSVQQPNFCNGTVPDLIDVGKLSLSSHGLALKCDKTIASWGFNHVHQLGNLEPTINFPTPGNYSPAAVPVLSNGVTLDDIISISSTSNASLAITSHGNVLYWGANINDLSTPGTLPQAGSGDGNPEFLRYQSGTLVEDAIAIEGGVYHFLILLRDGSVLSLGRNGFGQLGNGTFTSSIFPTLVRTDPNTFLSGIAQIATGDRHSMALAIDGTVFCWGDNGVGQLGVNSTVNSEFAIPVPGLVSIVGIAAGGKFSVAFSGSSAWAWGDNEFNQIGQSAGTLLPFLTPEPVQLPSGITEIKDIDCGNFHSIALTSDAKVYGWGDGYFTQLAVPPNDLSANFPPGSSPPINISDYPNMVIPIDEPLIKCDVNINYCYYNFEIDATTIWSTTSQPVCYLPNVILIENELLIRRGCSLMVNPGITLMFGPNGRIVLEEGDGVDDGAVLRLNNNVTLTAAGSCMWKGIEVRGNNAFGSGNSRQAKLIIDTGVLIEHAHNAITLGRWDENYYACYESYPLSFSSGFDLSGSGGQLECDQATFQNNAIDIRFAPYQRTSSSFIKDSQFLGGELRDNRYLNGTSNNPFYAPPNPLQRAHNAVNQWQVRVVLIEDNDFDDYETALQYTDSRLKVVDNTFTNCRIGINTLTTGAVLVYGGHVEGNSFTDVRTQIRAAGGKYLQVTNENHFNNIFPFGTQQDNQFGIFLNQERSFRIQDNHFTRLRHGIVSTNSGFSGGQINYLGQGNIFTECWRSIHLQQNHRNLRIKCNNYDNQTGSQYNSNWHLISNVTLSDQGWPSMTSEKTQAGNRFLQSPDFNELTSFSQNPFTYFRHASPNEVIPSATGAGIINIDANSAAMSDFDDACEPVVVPPGGEPDRLAYFAGVLDSLSLEMDTLINSLDNNLTDSLLNIIHPMYAQDTIMNRLTGNLPLSDAVLIKAIESPEALSDSALYEVLYLNSPYSNDVLEALNGRDPEFSEELRYELNQVQGLNPPYLTVTGLQKEIQYYHTDKQLLINDYVSRLVADDSTQKAISVLESENSYEHLQTIFGTYLELGELDSAEAKFEALMNHPDAEEDWLNLHEIHLDLVSETKTWFDMDSTQEATIRYIAYQDENTLAKVQAQNVLHLVFRHTFPDYIDEEEYYLRHQQPVINLTTLKSKPGSKQLTVKPNPANDFITVELKGSKQKSCYLEIIDITGKRHYYSKVEFKQNSYGMNVSFLNSGLYLVRVTDNIGFNESSKLVITR